MIRSPRLGAARLLGLLGLALVGCADAPPEAPSSSDAPAGVAAGFEGRDPRLPEILTPRGGQPSALWGWAGERWSPRGQLADFSHAGYHQGEIALPSAEPGEATRTGRLFDVRDFGAVGDGLTDDSAAFLAAVQAASDAAASAAAAEGSDEGGHWIVRIPEGRYRLEARIDLVQSRVVLRGESRDGTVLYFPRSLHDLYGQGTDGGPYGWSWGGGFVWARGEIDEGERIVGITADALRGDTSLEVESAAGLAPGRWVRLFQTEVEDGSLTLHLHAGFGLEGPCQVQVPGQRLVQWSFRIERIEGRRIHFDRPLRVDVRAAWQPELRTFEPTLEEVGVEHLTVEFPPTPQQPHHDEFGYNGIELQRVWNGWIRNVAVVNSDNAIQLWYSRNVTAQQILVTGRGGHYAINLGGSQDCLATEFRLENVSIHDLSFSNLGNGSVFSRGRGPFLNFDHHRGAAYENLASDIDVGAAWKEYRIWACSHTPSGHYAAARETFWNIRPKVIFAFTPKWPELVQIGPMPRTHNLRRANLNFWLEPIPILTPSDLHAAQLTQRLGHWPEALSAESLDERVPARP